MPSSLFLYSSDLPYAAPRIYKIDVTRFGIAGYDIDNGYPQRMLTLIKASPTAKMATKLYAKYIVGQGFDKDDDIWNTVFNSKGHTGDDLLTIAARDYSQFEKFYLHINYNALFQGVEINPVPYETVRYGIGDREGQIALYNDWWNNDRFGKLRNIEPTWVDTFSSDPEIIKQQVKNAGGWKSYRGQIFEFSKNFDMYPECTVDAAIEAMQAEILSYQTSKSNIKNNFGDKVVWVEKGKFQNDQEREDFYGNVQKFIGVDGEQVIVAEVNDVNEAPELKTVENRLDDKKFAYTDQKTRTTIYRLLGQNAVLHSDLTEGRYNQNQLPEARRAYNNDTEADRINMQRAFKQVFSILGYDSECAITPLNDLTSATQNTEGANANGTTTTTDPAE